MVCDGCCGFVGESICLECVEVFCVCVGILCLCVFFSVYCCVLFVGWFSVCLSGVYDEGIYNLLLINCVCLYLQCDLVP